MYTKVMCFKKTAISLIAMLSALACTGCGEELYDQQYYMENEKERIEKLAECKNLPLEKRTGNCVFAAEADAKIDISIMMGEGFKTEHE